MSNEIARAAVRGCTVAQARILAAIASQVEDDDPVDKIYDVPVSFVFPDSRPGGISYQWAIEAVRSLIHVEIVLPDPDNPDRIRIGSFGYAEYHKGVIRGGFHPAVKPFFLGLKERFTLFPLSEYLRLSTPYSQALYVLLRSWDDQISVEIPLDKLREKLNVTPSLRRDFGNLNNRAIAPSLREIHAKTSLRVKVEPVKEGRGFVAVRFVFKDRPKPKQSKFPETAPPPSTSKPKPDPLEHAKRVKAQAAAILAGSIGRGKNESTGTN